MSNTEIVCPSFELIQEIAPHDLPEVIASHVDGLKTLSVKVDDALKKAKDASEKVNTSEYSTTFRFFGDSQKNFETLNRGQSEIANATLAVSEGLQVAYENQEKLADISKYLFALGCSNIAANRSVVRQLELELTGASPGKLKDLAKSEIYGVIRQLKAQEDVLKKLEHLKESVKALHDDSERSTDELNKFKFEHEATDTKVGLLEKSFSEERCKWSETQEDFLEKLERLKESAKVLHEDLERNSDGLKNLKFEHEAVETRIDLLEKAFSETEIRLFSVEKRIKFAYIASGLGITLGIASLFFHL